MALEKGFKLLCFQSLTKQTILYVNNILRIITDYILLLENIHSKYTIKLGEW